MSGRDLQFLDSLVIAASSDDGDSSKNIQVIIADTTKKKLFQELTSHILSPSGKATETTKKLMTDLWQWLEAWWMDKIKRNASLSPEQQSFLSLIASEINVIKSDTITLIFNYNLFIDILFTLKSDNILSHPLI